jgi:acyl-CoA thioester hydrolase
MVREEFSFSYSLRVRWAEVDMQGVVFNGHYLTYFDVGFTEYWRATHLPSPIEQAKDGKELFVKKATLEYLASAKFDDELSICIRTGRIGNSSLTVLIGIFKDERLLVSGEMIYVLVNTALGTSVGIPSAWRETLLQFDSNLPDQTKD